MISAARAEDAAAIERLLSEHHLPLDGLSEHLATTLVVRDGDAVVGAAAVEVHPDGGLLRSVVVSAGLRGTGVGRRLVQSIIEIARDRRLPALYLLTTTAADYFPRLGFTPIERQSVPPGVQQSIEFRSACPASATVLRLNLEPEP